MVQYTKTASAIAGMLLLATALLSVVEATTTLRKTTTNKEKLENLVRSQNLLPPLMREEDLPIENAHSKWISLNEDVEFIPADNIDRRTVHRFLEQGNYYAEMEEEDTYGGMEGMESIYNVEPFINGDGDYDEYQQAWRLMGFIIDCYPMNDDDYYQNSGSGDKGTEDACARYVLWAAYVDMEYEGGGIGEYKFYNSTQKSWDTSACEASGSSRCEKMDCHLEDTHFSLLGFFKHKSYDDWMEQLFKHEGICVWNQEEYAFMKNARKAWPQGCIDSYTMTDSGEEIYYDIQPVQGGDIQIGLYTDTQCIKEYQSTGSNDPISVENILGNFFANNGGGSGSGDYGNYDFSSDTLDESMARWDSAFGKFRICQPCVAYDLENTDGTKFYDDDNGNAGDMFDCYDDADYTNVNQCMKFMAKTTMNTATFRDMSLGRYQGTLTATQMNGYSGAAKWRRESLSNLLTYLFLFLATSFFVYGGVYFYKAKVATNYQPTFGWVNFKEPLVIT